MTPPRKTEQEPSAPAADATQIALKDVGARLRRDREARGVGVRELARRIGVSPSLDLRDRAGQGQAVDRHALPDRRRAGPLRRRADARDRRCPRRRSSSAAAPGGLATALGAVAGGQAADALLARELADAPLGGEPDDPVQRGDARASVHLPGVTWERLTARDDAAVDFLYVTYEVGAESCPADNLMRHGGYEYGLILEGRLGIRIGFRTYELAAGDSISFDSMEPHRFWTVGDEPSRSVWLVVRRRNDPRLTEREFE